METALIVGIVLAAALGLIRLFRRSAAGENKACSCGHGCSCAHMNCSHHDLFDELDRNRNSPDEPRYSLSSDGKFRPDHM